MSNLYDPRIFDPEYRAKVLAPLASALPPAQPSYASQVSVPQPEGFDFMKAAAQGMSQAPPNNSISLGGVRMNDVPPAPTTPAPPPSPAEPSPNMSAAGPNMSVAPPTASSALQVGPSAPPGPELPPTAADKFAGRYLSAGGGAVNLPAKETELRGPSLLRAEDAANQAAAGAVDAVAARSAAAATAEYATHVAAAQQAYAREDAANDAAAQRAEELAQRQQDFDGSVKQLSQLSLDPDRFWASRTTGQKISGLIAIALGGFVQGARGGSNPGLDIINTAIDRDIKAQEFAYHALRDTAQAKQTAFGLAMAKYQNEDAARAAARAAALDAVQSQIAASSALWKGTQAANHADEALAQLEAVKQAQIQQGIAFTPARTVAAPRQFVDRRTGLVYSEKEAKELLAKGEGQDFELVKQGAGVAGQIMVEGAKEGARGGDKTEQAAADIAKQVQSAKIPQARALAENARQALVNSPISTPERFNILGSATTPTLRKVFYGREASEREQAWLAFKNDALHTLSGAAISPSEMPRLNAAFEGANDTESRLHAVELAQRALDEAERTAMATGNPKAQEQYRQNKQSAQTSGPTMPPSTKYPGQK